MKWLYEKTAFANELAGALSLHPMFTGLYIQDPRTTREHISKAIIDTISLMSICLLSIEEYREKHNIKDAIATALGTLLVAYIIPNMFLHKSVRKICAKRCSKEAEVAIAFLLLYGLYWAERPTIGVVNTVIGV